MDTSAHLAVEIALEEPVRAIECVGDQLLVVQDNHLHRVDGDRLELVRGDLEIVEMRDGWIRTPRELVPVARDAAVIPLPALGVRVASFVPLEQGALVSVDDIDRPDVAEVLRLDATGAVVWRAPVPPPATIGGHVSQARRETGFAIEPMPPWQPETWLADRIEISGDRVLAIFEETPRSGIGMGHGLDLASGRVVYRTEPGPHGELVAAPTPGQFLIGIQGYGAFETRLVDRDGVVTTTWPSQGRLAGRDPLRLVELENATPSRSHIATLHPDGTVHRGAHLPAYYTSSLVRAEDGSVLFWRDDALLRASPDGEHLERLIETPRRGRPHAFRMAGRAPGRLALGWTTMLDHRDGIAYEHRLFLIDVG